MRTHTETTARGQVTHRDGYIVAQALYWFIREQQKLPEEQFEWSNTEDAKLILRTLWPCFVLGFIEADHFWKRTPPKLEFEKYGELPANVVTLKR